MYLKELMSFNRAVMNIDASPGDADSIVIVRAKQIAENVPGGERISRVALAES